MLRNDERRPLYVQLKDAIIRDIIEGRRPPGSRMPPTVQLAGEYGVCHKTVQAAMSALTREGLVTRRPRHGTFVAHVCVEELRELSRKPRVALLMPYLGEEFTSSLFVKDMIDGVVRTAEECGCRLDFSVYSNFDSLVIDRSLTGCLLIRPEREEARKFKNLGLPALLLDISHPRLGVGFVQTDNIDGVMQAIKYLVGLRHTKILYAHNCYAAGHSFSASQRMRGFQKAAKRYRLPVEGYAVLVDDLIDRLETIDFTAVITDGYNATIRTLDALRRKSIRIPDDVSFVGFDDVEMAEHMPVPLTVVRQRLDVIGMMGLQNLLNSEMDLRRVAVLVKPELIVRASTSMANLSHSGSRSSNREKHEA
ncbi:MAG: substrate-binding domain-containing protein [Firmicutes bacterium]|nr:substrate-binding domain-containing protein [Bacillota bacterium]